MKVLADRLSLAVLLAGTAITLGCADDPGSRNPPAPTQPAPEPSILLISVDTMRADHLGCYGDPDAVTPNLDRWAAQGVLFENVATPVPITLPAHASLLTGLVPSRHGARDNGTYALPLDVATLAEVLSSHGYDTGAVVGAEVLDRGYGIGQGFRLYDDRVAPAGFLAISERTADRVTDAALQTAASLRRPFFLFVHYFDPHADYRPPPPFAREFAARPYDGEIAFVDREIGRLRDGLEASGALPNGVVAIVSDHGEGLGEHGETAHGIFLYQSTVHVPWILVGPGRIPSGRRSSVFAALTDVMPTLLDLVGVPVPEGLDGRSLRERITSESAEHSPERWLLLESEFAYNAYRWAPLKGLTNGSMKWIGAPRQEVYDLSVDPHERVNAAAADPERRARLESLWRERFTSDRRTALQQDPTNPEDAERLARLESLGYVSATGKAGARTGPLPDPKDVIGTLDRVNEARRLMSSRAIPAAVAVLESVLRVSPDNVSALILLGAARIEGGQPAQAVAPLRRAAVLAPHKADVHFNLGLALLGAADDAGAINAWRRTLRVAPRNESAAINLIDLLLQMGRTDEAAQTLADARTAKIDNPILDYLEGRLALARGDRAAARAALGRALARPLPPAIAADARRLLGVAQGPG